MQPVPVYFSQQSNVRGAAKSVTEPDAVDSEIGVAQETFLGLDFAIPISLLG